MPLIQLKDAVNRSYDYVIVGGGTAGLVLAARLTEDAEISVLVLESGEENLNDPLITKTAQCWQAYGQKEYDWCATTTPQVHSNDTVFPWPRGRILGGSSAINYGVWNKPSREDIDAWEKLGNEGWNWEKFNKYTERAISFTPLKLSEAEHTRRGTPDIYRELWQRGPVGKGPIQVSYPPLRTDLDVKIQRAFQELGIAIATAPLDGNPNGVVLGPMTVDPKTIQRSFAGNAYWEPNSARPNLNILTGASAHRLATTEVDGELLITGVEFSYKNDGEETYMARALKEVILSAGALMTPKMLELSGIGSPEVLRKVGIPIKLALNGVGENVQDHLHASVVVELKDDVPDLTYDVLRNPGEAEKHLVLFAQGQGLFTMGVTSFIYAPLGSLSDKAQEIISDARRKIEADMASGKYPPGLVEQYRIILDDIEKVPSCEVFAFPGYYGGQNIFTPGKKYYTFTPALNRPFSRGTIHVTSSDPTVHPAIDPSYFKQDIDLKIMREITKFCRRIAGTAVLKDYFGESPQELNPGPTVTTDKDIEAYMKRYVCSTYHAVGSASMLPREKGGVVDTKLKVYGTKNLRIVDLSIVPLHFGSHSQCIAYGIGEIAADIIKGLV